MSRRFGLIRTGSILFFVPIGLGFVTIFVREAKVWNIVA